MSWHVKPREKREKQIRESRESKRQVRVGSSLLLLGRELEGAGRELEERGRGPSISINNSTSSPKAIDTYLFEKFLSRLDSGTPINCLATKKNWRQPLDR